ncbi:MAG TPA: hypothetical protein VGX69_08600 [Solirubrobacteraceae bacterium]|nr:hypothetical protein [Solirubrobacteraceae bacterium]
MTVALATLAALGTAAALAGCGSTVSRTAGAAARAAVSDPMPATPGSCAATALEALGHVAAHVYHEGVSSERTLSALGLVESSASLRSAVEAGDAAAVRGAARALVATGHLTSLRVTREGRVLAAVGAEGAVAPLSGTLTRAGGAPLARFTTSVWTDGGVIAETNGIAEGRTVLRTQDSAGGGRTIAGALELPAGELAPRGTLTRGGTTYEYTSFPASAYPSGRPLREYLLRALGSLRALCGADAEATTVNTLSRVARLIYDGESGGRTLAQVRRVQRDRPLLQAVARRDPRATRAAIVALLTEHVVRLRVTVGGRVLSDVGGPYVLAPVSAPLRLGARTIGRLTLSIQDDEGYKRLVARLAGLDSVMYMGSRLVKSTIGYTPDPVPTSGAFDYRGRRYRAYTFAAEAFPSGPLRITVLIPIPYS